MDEQEYGYDTENMRFFTDEEMTIEINLEDIPREVVEKILGGVPIVRCKNCENAFKQGLFPDDLVLCKEMSKLMRKTDYCSLGKGRKEDAGKN